MTYQLHHGNCLDIMALMERDSVDSIVTDPPYGLGFMGKDWDHGVPGEHFWREAYHVAKPGAHLLAFGGTRTFHRLAVAIEDAGWEIRDCVMWVYGSGFPKSHDVSKAIDKEAGAEREVIGTRTLTGNAAVRGGNEIVRNNGKETGTAAFVVGSGLTGKLDIDITKPATEQAQEWDGWGTALKPAWEPIIVARKPLQGTVAENVQRYGTGAMNIDACRIGIETLTYKSRLAKHMTDAHANEPKDSSYYRPFINGLPNRDEPETTTQGRWPANLIHDGSAEVLAGFPQARSSMGGGTHRNDQSYGLQFTNPPIGYRSDQYYDTGSAARFFYCAKASKADRDEGCEGFDLRNNMRVNAPRESEEEKTSERSRNSHPTVKPTSLMRYLCRLVTPPNGVVLDPFMGSGSTGKAAILEGFNFIGVDTEIEYVEIAARRIEHACEKVGIVIDQPMLFDTKRETVDKPKQLILL